MIVSIGSHKEKVSRAAGDEGDPRLTMLPAWSRKLMPLVFIILE